MALGDTHRLDNFTACVYGASEGWRSLTGTKTGTAKAATKETTMTDVVYEEVKRFNVSAPIAYQKAFMKEANACGMNRSDWLDECALAAIRKHFPKIADRLSPRKPMALGSVKKKSSPDTNTTERMNCSAPIDHHAAFKQVFADMGYTSMSEFLCTCGAVNLPESTSRKLPALKKPGQKNDAKV